MSEKELAQSSFFNNSESKYNCIEFRDCDLNCIRAHPNPSNEDSCRKNCPNCNKLTVREVVWEYANPLTNNAKKS